MAMTMTGLVYHTWGMVTMPMAGMAATLDTIAEQPGVEAARAESLHQVLDYILYIASMINNA